MQAHESESSFKEPSGLYVHYYSYYPNTVEQAPNTKLKAQLSSAHAPNINRHLISQQVRSLHYRLPDNFLREYIQTIENIKELCSRKIEFKEEKELQNWKTVIQSFEKSFLQPKQMFCVEKIQYFQLEKTIELENIFIEEIIDHLKKKENDDNKKNLLKEALTHRENRVKNLEEQKNRLSVNKNIFVISLETIKQSWQQFKQSAKDLVSNFINLGQLQKEVLDSIKMIWINLNKFTNMANNILPSLQDVEKIGRLSSRDAILDDLQRVSTVNNLEIGGLKIEHSLLICNELKERHMKILSFEGSLCDPEYDYEFKGNPYVYGYIKCLVEENNNEVDHFILEKLNEILEQIGQSNQTLSQPIVVFSYDDESQNKNFPIFEEDRPELPFPEYDNELPQIGGDDDDAYGPDIDASSSEEPPQQEDAQSTANSQTKAASETDTDASSSENSDQQQAIQFATNNEQTSVKGAINEVAELSQSKIDKIRNSQENLCKYYQMILFERNSNEQNILITYLIRYNLMGKYTVKNVDVKTVASKLKRALQRKIDKENRVSIKIFIKAFLGLNYKAEKNKVDLNTTLPNDNQLSSIHLHKKSNNDIKIKIRSGNGTKFKFTITKEESKQNLDGLFKSIQDKNKNPNNQQ